MRISDWSSDVCSSDLLEDKEEIFRLLDNARRGSATKIFIGSENKLFSLSGSSVIAAPYRSGDGRVVGVVGVIGPPRLNYARVVPMVDFTAQTLSRLMSCQKITKCPQKPRSDERLLGKERVRPCKSRWGRCD